MMQKKTVTMSDRASMCHSIATDAMMSERQTLQTKRVWPIEVESPWHYAHPTLFVSHIHWWCYFSHHFALGLKGSAAIVTQARAPWHILKWPPALSLGVLTFGFTSFSCCYSCISQSLSCPLCSYLLLPSLPCILQPPQTQTDTHARTHTHTCIPFHPLISAPLSFSLRGYPCFFMGTENNWEWSG